MPTARPLTALLLGGAVLLSGCGHATSGDASSSSHPVTAGARHTRSTHASGTHSPGSPTSSRGRGGSIGPCSVQDLPAQVPPVIEAIKAGGPFKHPRNDGVTFGNLEGILPREPRGYYREYTVDTPGARTRGTRRIITGGDQAQQPEHWYYTGDHYQSFCEISDA